MTTPGHFNVTTNSRSSSAFLLLTLLLFCGPNPVLTSTRHQLRMHWWTHPPYTSQNLSTWGLAQITGVIPIILTEIMPLCNVSEINNQSEFVLNVQYYSAPLDFQRESHSILQPVNSTLSELYLPVAIRAGEETKPFVHPNKADPLNLVFIPVLTSPGAVHFYKMSEEPVANDLLNVILQGWPMLILIMLGAGYSGIMIWLLVRTHLDIRL